MKEVKKESFRSGTRSVFESYDMYRVVLDMSMKEYQRLHKLIKEIEEEKKKAPL
jgi:hypothetical protein